MLTKKIKTEEKKRLIENIFSLSVMQGLNYLLPLLTIPYLVRVLGPEYFGLLAFATATIMYFMMITDYGFNLSATRQISIYRNDKDKVNQIFSSVLMTKTVLMIVCLAVMALLVFSSEKFSQHWEVYFITFGMVIGNTFFPVWLFQGMEQMKYITYLNIVTKVFFTACIFIFVKEQADYLLVPFLTAMGFIVTGVWSLFLAKKKFNVHFKIQKKTQLKIQLADGWHVFFSTLAVSLYTISSTFLLGLLTNYSVVGYFAAADKIVQAARGLYTPVSQAIFPLIGKKIHEDKQAGLAFIYKTTLIAGSTMLIISLLLLLFAQQIVNLLLGPLYQQSVLLLQILSFLPFAITLSNIFGIQTMLNLGYERELSFFFVITAISGIVLSMLLTPSFQAIGVSIAMLIVEVLISILLGSFLILKIKKGAL
jgi:PST family polysaccharide transporter